MTKIWRKVTALIATIMAGLMMISITVYAVVNAQRSVIDTALGTTSWTIVTEDTDDENLYNFEALHKDGTNIDGEEVTVDVHDGEFVFASQKVAD